MRSRGYKRYFLEHMRMTIYPIVKTKATERTARKTVKYLAVSDIPGSSSVTISVFVTFVMIYSLAFVVLLE